MLDQPGQIVPPEPEAASAWTSMFHDVLEAADVGLAVFDRDLSLIGANHRYLELCGYDPTDVCQGTPLAELIERSLAGRGLTSAEIDTAVATTLERLKSGGAHRFNFHATSGRNISVARHRNAGGILVETVREVEGSNEQGRNQLAHMAETAHSRMTYALDSIIDGFALFDSEDRLVAFNRQYADLSYGAGEPPHPGISFDRMLRNAVDRGVFEQNGMDAETYIKWRLQQHYSPGDPHEMQLKDGRWVRILERETQDGGTAATATDISELKRRELQLQDVTVRLEDAHNKFNFALNNMIQGLCMFDQDMRLILCNRQYLEMYGFSSEVVKPGISIPDIMRYSISLGNYRDEDAQAALEARHDPNRLRRRSTIKQYLRDGRVIAVMNEPMPDGSSIATYQDITALERHEARLRDYNAKLERSNRELQDFAHVASHDLQEPLRKIEAFGDRLVKKYGDALPQDGQMYIDRMQNAASRMRSLINDLLDYSRVTTKARRFETTDMSVILDGVLSDMQVTIRDYEAAIEIGEMPSFQVDGTQMRQLTQNLISNALKFRKKDVAPIVRISAERVMKETTDGAMVPFWRFEFRDNGIGFENQYKDQIFAIFKRLHGRSEYEGTGIGLATCRKIVERHHGTIDAFGELDVGATFVVELPEKHVEPEEED